jgi:hypothetical protein
MGRMGMSQRELRRVEVLARANAAPGKYPPIVSQAV